MSLRTMKRKGFTMVEMLVVITIIAVIAAVVSISYSQFMKQSRDAKRKTDIEQIRAAIEMYRSNNNAYPNSLVFTGAGTVADGSVTYLSLVPNDPRSTLTYYYTSPVGNQSYTLCAYLETVAPSGSNACGTLGGASVTCNYCMGPYGQL